MKLPRFHSTSLTCSAIEDKTTGRSGLKRRWMRDDRPLVVLLDASSGAALLTAQSLHHTGDYRVMGIASTRQCHMGYSSKYRLNVQPQWNWEAGVEQLDTILAQEHSAILFPMSTEATLWLIQHREQLARNYVLPPLPTASALRLMADKESFNHYAREIGCQVPAFVALEGPDTDIDQLSFPVLLKPVVATGGEGIKKFSSAIALRAYLDQYPLQRRTLVQSYVEGADLSCGVLCESGRVVALVTYKCLAREGEFGSFRVITRVEFPAVTQAVCHLMHTTRWTGLINLDLRLTPEGHIYFLEANPRPWGNILATTLWGVNFPDFVCRMALQRPLAHIQSHDAASSESEEQRFYGMQEGLLYLLAFSSGHSLAQRAALTWKQSGLSFSLRDPLPYGFSVARRLRTRSDLIGLYRNHCGSIGAFKGESPPMKRT